MSVEQMEATTDEHSSRVLALMEDGRRNELAEYVNGLEVHELAWLVLAFGNALLNQETTNDALVVKLGILRQQNETLDTANANLFAEKRQLLDKVTELREIQSDQADMLSRLRKQLKART